MPESKQLDLLQRFLDTSMKKKDRLNAECLHSVLQLLQGEPDSRQFEDLKIQVDDDWRQQCVISRCGHSKQAAAAATPLVIKALKPPGPKIVLCWQTAVSCFEGYYPRPAAVTTTAADGKKKQRKVKTHFSTSRKYGDNVRGKQVTQFEALRHVVNFLWSHHKRAKGDAHMHERCRPVDCWRLARPALFVDLCGGCGPKDLAEKPSDAKIHEALEKCGSDPDTAMAEGAEDPDDDVIVESNKADEDELSQEAGRDDEGLAASSNSKVSSSTQSSSSSSSSSSESSTSQDPASKAGSRGRGRGRAKAKAGRSSKQKEKATKKKKKKKSKKDKDQDGGKQKKKKAKKKDTKSKEAADEAPQSKKRQTSEAAASASSAAAPKPKNVRRTLSPYQVFQQHAMWSAVSAQFA